MLLMLKKLVNPDQIQFRAMACHKYIEYINWWLQRGAKVQFLKKKNQAVFGENGQNNKLSPNPWVHH